MNLPLICHVFISAWVLHTHLAAVLNTHPAEAAANATLRPSYWFTVTERPDVRFRCAYCIDEDAEKQDPVPRECWDQLEQGLIKEEIHGGVRYSPVCLGTRGTNGGYYKNCTAPPAPGDGVKAVCPDGILFDHQCSLTSSDERFLPTPNFTLCQADGNWTDFELTAKYCFPLESILYAEENTLCPRDENLPVKKECEVRNKKNEVLRRLQCNKSGKWKLTENFELVSGPENTAEFALTIGLASGLAVMVFFFIVTVCMCVKCYRQKLAASPASSQAGSPLLDSTSPQKQAEFQLEVDEKANDNDNQENCGEEDTGGPPAYSFTSGHGGEEKCQAAATAVNSDGIKLYYKTGDDNNAKELPEYGITPISIKAGGLLTVYSNCACQVTILGFRMKRSQQDFVKISVDESNHDKEYHVCAECEGKEIMTFGHFRIVVADHNPDPDDTSMKHRFKRSSSSLTSTDSTLSGNTINAASGLSEKLKAEPFSLKSLASQPEALYESNSSLSSSVDKLQVRSPEEPAADNHEDCTLPLCNLKDKKHKTTLKQLCLKLEPISSVQMSAAGVAEAQNVVSYDEARHIIWAKREDLKDSPARVMLTLMMQYGIMAAHVVSYFDDSSHRRLEIVRLLQQAHPDCPVCGKYGR